jgi:hypothetical protein
MSELRITHLKIDNFTFENVENFNYLGSILNANNKNNIENAGKKIANGNKVYYAIYGLWFRASSITRIKQPIRHTVPDNVHQLHVQQPSTYAKPEPGSAVLGS